MRLVKALFSAHIQFSWDLLWCCVSRLCCLCWCVWFVSVPLHGPRIACFGLECEKTHKHTHREKKKTRSWLPIILHSLTSLNSITHTAHCLCMYICDCTPSSRKATEAESECLVIKHTEETHRAASKSKVQSSPKCWRGFNFFFLLMSWHKTILGPEI